MIKKILSLLFPIEYLTPKFIGTGVAGAIVGAGATEAIGGVLTGLTAAGAGGAATGVSREMYEQGRADLAPFREAGLGAIGRYQELLRDPSKVKETPGYQFRMEEGLEGVMRKGAAGGKLFSGETGKGLVEFGQQYATSEYDKALQREFSLAQMGATAASGQAQQAGTAGQTLANIQMQQGQQVGSAYGTIASGMGDVLGGKGYAEFLERPYGRASGMPGRTY